MSYIVDVENTEAEPIEFGTAEEGVYTVAVVVVVSAGLDVFDAAVVFE